MMATAHVKIDKDLRALYAARQAARQREILQLAARRQEALRLREEEGLKYWEIAEQLGVTTQRAHAMVKSARAEKEQARREQAERDEVTA